MSQESGRSTSDVDEMGAVMRKRRRDLSSEDDSLHLSKYRRFSTEQKIKNLKTEDMVSENSSYDTEDDSSEFCASDKNKCLKYEIVPDSDEQPENDCNRDDETNTSCTLEKERKQCIGSESESDVDSVEVPSTEELDLLEDLSKSGKKVQRLRLISAAYQITNRIMSTSEFSNSTVDTKNHKADNSCEENGILNDCQVSEMHAAESRKVIKTTNVNAKDLPSTEIMESQDIAQSELVITKNIIKSEIISETVASKNVNSDNKGTFVEKICSENEKIISKNINSACEKNVLENIDSGYDETVPENITSRNKKVEVENIDSTLKKAQPETTDSQYENTTSENILPENLNEMTEIDSENARSKTEKIKSVVEHSNNLKIHTHVDTVYHTNQSIKAASSDLENVSTLQTENIDEAISNFENPKTETNISVNMEVNQIEVPESTANECTVPENEQEVAIQSLLSNNDFEISESTNNGDSENVYTVQKNSSNTHTYEHSYQTPSTSALVDDVMTEVNRTSSVSDLNVAQLFLSIKQDLHELTNKVDKQGTVLEAVVNANEINLTPLFAQTFQEKYNLQTPYTKIEDFDKFNQNLTKNTRFCNEFITSLCSYIDNNVTLTKNILNMLRKYMSKELASLYTASKATGNKMVLKDTIFCKCLLQATRLTIRNGLLPLEHEKAFMKSLGLVVSGAKSWVTHDDDRRKSTQH